MGETQREFAKACNLSYRLYQRLEKADANPTLSSLSAIATRLQCDISELLRLKTIRVNVSSDSFARVFQEEFEGVDFPTWIRTSDAKPIWANRICLQMHDLEDIPKAEDVSRILSPESIEAFKQQVVSQRLGIAEPYTNSIRKKDGRIFHYRYHPTLIYESRSSEPQLVASYLSDISNSAEALYHRFTDGVIRCVKRLESLGVLVFLLT